MFQKRLRKRIEPPIRAVIVSSVIALLGLALFMVQLVWAEGAHGWQAVVMLYLLGAVTLVVMGFAYKIVPFLVWRKRYSKPSTTTKPVLISHLINLNKAWPVFIAFLAGLSITTVSSLLDWNSAAMAGTIFMGLGILLFCLQIFQVFGIRALGKELFKHD